MTKVHKQHLQWLMVVESGRDPKPMKVSFRAFRTLQTMGFVDIVQTRGAYEVARLTDKGKRFVASIDPITGV